MTTERPSDEDAERQPVPPEDHWDSGMAFIDVYVPPTYPKPSEGPATRWDLRTPEGEPVGDLVFNDGGLRWTFVDAEDPSMSAQEHGTELLLFLRSNYDVGTSQEEVLHAISLAYAGDYDASPTRVEPATEPA